jgi:hypothetical protein
MTQLRIINPIKITQILITYFPPKLKFKYTCKTSAKFNLTVIFGHFGRRTGTTAQQKERERGRLGEWEIKTSPLHPFSPSPPHSSRLATK